MLNLDETHCTSSVTNDPMLEILMDRIVPDPEQPRKEFDEHEHRGLVESIKQHGLLQPIVVTAPDDTGKYRILMGERRWRAYRELGHEKIRAVVRTSPIESLRFVQMHENLERSGVKPRELGLFVQKRMAEGMTKTDIARSLRLTTTALDHALAVLDPPEELRKAWDEGKFRTPIYMYQLRHLRERNPALVDAEVAAADRITSSFVKRLDEIIKGAPAKTTTDADAGSPEVVIPEAQGEGEAQNILGRAVDDATELATSDGAAGGEHGRDDQDDRDELAGQGDDAGVQPISAGRSVSGGMQEAAPSAAAPVARRSASTSVQDSDADVGEGDGDDDGESPEPSPAGQTGPTVNAGPNVPAQDVLFRRGNEIVRLITTKRATAVGRAWVFTPSKRYLVDVAASELQFDSLQPVVKVF